MAYQDLFRASISKQSSNLTGGQYKIAEHLAKQQIQPNARGGYNWYQLAKKTDEVAKALFQQQAPAQAPAPAPAPAPAAPASSSPQEPQLTDAAKKYREESEANLAKAQKLLDDFKIEQNKAAEAKKLQEQMAIRAQGTLASNLAMSQRKPSLQLSPASQTPQTAGTQPFKRRRLQVMTPGSQVTSGLNIGSANLLNV